MTLESVGNVPEVAAGRLPRALDGAPRFATSFLDAFREFRLLLAPTFGMFEDL